MKRKALAARSKANNQVQKQHRQNTRNDEENKRKPHTDDKLSLLLKEEGYPIARRTVAKYREQLDIPVARLRKEF